MVPYQLSDLNRPLADAAASEKWIDRFKPLEAAVRGKIVAEVHRKGILDPPVLAVLAVKGIPDPPRGDLLNAAEAALKAKDDLGFMSVHRHLASALLELVIRDEAPADVAKLNAAKTAKDVSKAFDAKKVDLYQDALSEKLDGWGTAINQRSMSDLHRHLTAKKVKLDSPDLRARVFGFLGKLPAAPAPPAPPATTSNLVTPLSDAEIATVLKDLPLLKDPALSSVRKRIKSQRITDPQAVRAIAVEAALSAQKLRELTRSIRAIISLDGGSGYLRGFSKLPETILYEFIKDTNKKLVDLCHPEIGCELRTFAESFFRDRKDELYKDRIREALSARGFALDEQRLEHTYRHMLRQRIPLPARPLPGAIR